MEVTVSRTVDVCTDRLCTGGEEEEDGTDNCVVSTSNGFRAEFVRVCNLFCCCTVYTDGLTVVDKVFFDDDLFVPKMCTFFFTFSITFDFIIGAVL